MGAALLDCCDDGGGGGANMREELEKGVRWTLLVSWLWQRRHIDDNIVLDIFGFSVSWK